MHLHWTRNACHAEIWNPLTQTWTNDASAKVPRVYHSVAVLVPDGRVFVGGGGLCGACTVNHLDAEMYSPKYLFNADGSPAARPTITLSVGSLGALPFACCACADVLALPEVCVVVLAICRASLPLMQMDRSLRRTLT
jgi:hypothetical protein